MNGEKGVVLFEKKGPIALITLNRPERRNAISGDVVIRLHEVFESFNKDRSLRVAVLTGAGDKAFCAGGDLQNMAGEGSQDSLFQKPFPFLLTEIECWKPIIAAINGHAIAGGWLLAQHADIRIASEDAKLGITEAKWGLQPSWIADLPRQIPLGIVLELCFTGELISAQRAYEIGFVNHVVPREQVLPKAMEMAELVASNAPLTVQAMKESLYRSLPYDRKTALAIAEKVFEKVRKSEDFKSMEGPRAFVEKRKPEFKGR